MRGALVVAIAVPVVASAQFFSVNDEHPQFRAHSGMPGGGYGVGRDGRIGPSGAWAIATPIAYALRPWEMALGLGAVSKDQEFQFLDRGEYSTSQSNGAIAFSIGLPLGSRYGMLALSYMVLSSFFDNASHLNWTPPGQRGPLTFGVGVQGMDGGDGKPDKGLGRHARTARSFFVVGTWAGPNGTYVTLGKGTRRFERVFGSASTNVLRNLKLVAEQDGYNWNWGLGYDFGETDPGVRRGERAGASLFAGFVRGHANWWLTFRF